MATITVTKEPVSLAAGENPILLELQTASSGSTESYPLTTIKVNNGVTANVDYIQVSIIYPMLRGIRFSSKSVPTAPTDFLPSGFTFIFTPITFTNSEIATSLGEAMRSDPTMATYYSTYVSGDTVFISGKIASQRFALATGTTVSGGNNIITASSYTKFTITTVDTGQAAWQGDLENRYAMWVDLFMDNVPNPKPFVGDLDVTDMQYVNTFKKNWQFGESTLDFDLSNVVKSYTSTPTPAYSTGFTGSYVDYIRNYKAQYGDYKQISFNSIIPALAGFPQVLKVSKGFIENKWVTAASKEFTSTNTMLDYYSGGTVNLFAGKALTLSPAYKPVFLDQATEYIYFLNKQYAVSSSLVYNLEVIVEYYYIDGSYSLGSPILTKAVSGTTTNTLDGLWRVNVAPQHVDIDSNGFNGGKQVRDYQVRIFETVSQIIDTKTYTISEVQPASGTEIMWLNEFGTHDTFFFGGTTKTGIDRDTKEQLKYVPYDYPEGFEYESQYDTEVYDIYQLTSTFVTEEVFNWLKGCLNSNKAYIIESNRANFVTITDFSYEKDAANNTYSVSITIKRTIFKNNVSV